jgi:CRISPR-associated protein Cst1
MDNEKLKIELTGNPFVDTGIGVIASLAKLDEVNQLTLADIKSIYGDGSQLIEWNSKLKTFSQVFGTNNPLFHPSFGFKKGKGPSETNKKIYKNTLEGLLSEIGKSEKGPRCWACGNPSDFDFSMVWKKAVEGNGKKTPEEKWVGRDWFPLAGSLGSDAQALPAASMPPHICPKCLFAIHYLPMGLILLEGRLAVFQCTSTEFWYEFLCNGIVEHNKGRIQSGDYETLGKKDGNNALLRRLLDYLKQLKKEVPDGTELYVWKFSNSGASPECTIEVIPNPALEFLRDAVSEGCRSEIETLIGTEGKNQRYSLFQCILDRRDYPNLYPEGKRKGASMKLFSLYQLHIRNHSISALQMSHKLAKVTAGVITEKELKRIQRPEAFNKEEKVRNQLKASMIKMAEKGEFTLEDYLDLFPLKEGNGVTVEWDGWNFIRFHLHHITEDFSIPRGKQNVTGKANLQLFYYAGQIYNRYLDEKGKDRFIKEVLEQMDRGIGASWLRNQFVQLAESENGFNYSRWSNLCKLDNGRLFVSELLLQMRLLWTQWLQESLTSVNVPILKESVSTDRLPEHIKASIEAVFTDYINRRGLDRFHRDILLRLRRKEIGLFWFKEKLTKQISEFIQPLTEEEWEKFLVDDEGRSAKTERLFQLHLALANLYRVKVVEENIRRK